MWIARDSFGVVTLFEERPTRLTDGWFAEGHSMPVPDSFPKLTWESEPLEVSVIENTTLRFLNKRSALYTRQFLKCK